MGNALALSSGGRLSLPQSNCSLQQVSAYLRLPRVMNGEGDGTPLQCSCLENPRDRGAW